jgi:carbon starvation protein
MNTLIAIIIGAITIIIGYHIYAKYIDRRIIEADPKKATPARLYMDGVDFIPTSRNILYGYHFKSIAAAGPIVGSITAATLWGWLPSLLWLMVGVVFIGWASDYSAIMVAVRNDGNSLSAIAHKLIAPRTRVILLLFIFFYLLLVAGAFGGIMAGVLNANTQVPLGIVMLMLMGLLAGQMLYRWKTDLILVTVVTVGITLAAVLVGLAAPVQGAVTAINNGINAITGNQPLVVYFDPTQMNPQTNTLGVDVKIMPSFAFWLLFIFLFCYLGTVLPIWRYAQPVNYIGFWITGLTMFFAFLGAALAVVVKPEVATFQLPAFKGFMAPAAAGAIQPLWPMLFVTIACGAISGWHALFGSVGTSRQLEFETDALFVGGGAMFTEFTLALISLLAITVAGKGAGAGAFAAGIGNFLSVFGVPVQSGAAFGLAAFVVIVITVTQLVFRLMRVTLGEGLGDSYPVFRNIHVSTIISMALTAVLVMTGTWIYLWQLFGGANQLMASLSLLVVTVWLVSTRRNPLYAGIPMVFMYVTTIFAIGVTAYNLWVTVFLANLGKAGREVPVIGGFLMVAVAVLLIVAAIFIGYDGFTAINRYRQRPMERPAPAPGG